MPHLSALKTFEVAARYESFVRAAEELHVTHGAVSKQIRNLEEDLGEALFHRRNRAVFLTERGRLLGHQLAAVFSDLENTLTDFRAHRSQQPLIVSCEPTLCLKLLIPNMPALKERTGLEVRVLAAGGQIDFRRDHVDLAVRRNDFPIAPQIYRKDLAPEAMGLVCSPRVAAALAMPLRDKVPALHTRSRPDAWSKWKKPRTSEFKPSGDVIFEHFYLAIEAAMAGQGVVLASVHMVAGDLVSGRLTNISDFRHDGTYYVALSESDFSEDPRRMIFTNWLQTLMKENLAQDLVCDIE